MAHIGLVEIAAALAGKQRGGHLTPTQYEQLVAELTHDAQSEYVLVRVTESIVDEAVDLTRQHRLRGYDAVHLTCALQVNRVLLDRHQSPLTLVASDGDLLAAAQASGLATQNPNSHPQTKPRQPYASSSPLKASWREARDAQDAGDGGSLLGQRLLSEGEVDALLIGERTVMLTDRYAPVDQMLAPVFRGEVPR